MGSGPDPVVGIQKRQFSAFNNDLKHRYSYIDSTIRDFPGSETSTTSSFCVQIRKTCAFSKIKRFLGSYSKNFPRAPAIVNATVLLSMASLPLTFLADSRGIASSGIRTVPGAGIWMKCVFTTSENHGKFESIGAQLHQSVVSFRRVRFLL
jgi:hypothetical protein